MNYKAVFLFPLAFISLVGCNTTAEKNTPQRVANVPLSIPIQTNFRNEIAIARYSELLLSVDLPKDQMAELYYNRGRLYDSLGLSTLATIDFNRALKLNAKMAQVYNFIGVHNTLSQEFNKAYEMFDSVLELDSEHKYVYLNRGIALYYGGRNKLAETDFLAFYNFAPEQGIRAIWLYLSQAKDDPAFALNQLNINKKRLDQDTWTTQIVSLYLGEISESAFLSGVSKDIKNQEEYALRLCEAYFYLGKLYQLKAKPKVAIDFFKLALATNAFEYIEHKYARLELAMFAYNNGN